MSSCNCPPTLKPSEMKAYVTVERPTSTPNESGGYRDVWAPLFKAWSKFEMGKGWEKNAQGQLRPTQIVKFSFRFNDAIGLRETDRINFDGRLFNIRLINNVEMYNSILEVTMESGVTQ